MEPDGDDQDVGREEEPPVDHLVVGRLGQTLWEGTKIRGNERKIYQK